MNKQISVTLITLFVLLTGGLFALHSVLPAYSFVVLEGGNALLFALSFMACFLVYRQQGKNGSAFVRGVTGATFLKLMVCLIAALVFIFTHKDNLHKPTIFVLFGLYLIYSASETMYLQKAARKQSV